RRLATEARDGAIIMATAADRAELQSIAVGISQLAQELGSEGGVGIVIQSAYEPRIKHRRIYANAKCGLVRIDLSLRSDTLRARARHAGGIGELAHGLGARRRARRDELDQHVDLVRREARALRDVAGLVLAALAQQQG